MKKSELQISEEGYVCIIFKWYLKKVVIIRNFLFFDIQKTLVNQQIKEILLFNWSLISESKINLIRYSTNHWQQELYMHYGFLMPPGGFKSGPKSQLVFYGKKTNVEATEDDELSND